MSNRGDEEAARAKSDCGVEDAAPAWSNDGVGGAESAKSDCGDEDAASASSDGGEGGAERAKGNCGDEDAASASSEGGEGGAERASSDGGDEDAASAGSEGGKGGAAVGAAARTQLVDEPFDGVLVGGIKCSKTNSSSGSPTYGARRKGLMPCEKRRTTVLLRKTAQKPPDRQPRSA